MDKNKTEQIKIQQENEMLDWTKQMIELDQKMKQEKKRLI